jgi:hypothetical protein
MVPLVTTRINSDAAGASRVKQRAALSADEIAHQRPILPQFLMVR